MTETLQFDPIAHVYTLNGRELISVTQALSEAGLIDKRWFSEEAAARGTAVHDAVQRLHRGEQVSVGEAVVPYVDAWLDFQIGADYVIEACEERVCDPLRGYAGTLDLRGRFSRYPSGVDVIDIKTGTIPASVGYQTAAYARLLSGGIKRRWALNLRADGTYRLEPLTARTDEQVFLAALTIAQAKRGWL